MHSEAQQHMTKRYAVRTLRLAQHKRRRAALGRKLNMPKDKAAMRKQVEAMMIKHAYHLCHQPVLINDDGTVQRMPRHKQRE